MYLFSTFVDLPDATEMIASTSDWASPVYDSLKPFMYIALGLIVAVGIILFVINLFRSIFGQ